MKTRLTVLVVVSIVALLLAATASACGGSEEDQDWARQDGWNLVEDERVQSAPAPAEMRESLALDRPSWLPGSRGPSGEPGLPGLPGNPGIRDARFPRTGRTSRSALSRILICSSGSNRSRAGSGPNSDTRPCADGANGKEGVRSSGPSRFGRLHPDTGPARIAATHNHSHRQHGRSWSPKSSPR